MYEYTYLQLYTLVLAKKGMCDHLIGSCVTREDIVAAVASPIQMVKWAAYGEL
jgi:hypothetical protein